MTPIEKFIRENYSPTITENKDGLQCIFKHKEGITEDSIVYFEFAKKKWERKPVISNRQYVIVDAHTNDLLSFLHTFYNLDEEDYHQVRKIIVEMAMSALDNFYGD